MILFCESDYLNFINSELCISDYWYLISTDTDSGFYKRIDKSFRPKNYPCIIYYNEICPNNQRGSDIHITIVYKSDFDI